MSDEDVLASSSAGWKAVALPEPAKMVSLPELADLPSKRDLKVARKARAKAEPPPRTAEGTAPSERVESSAAAALPAAPAASVAAAPAPASAPHVAPKPAFSPSRAPGKSRGTAIAIGGIVLAAAAGLAIYVGTQHHASPAPAAAPAAPPQVAQIEPAPAPPAAAPAAAPAPPPAPVAAPADTAVAAAPEPAPVATTGHAERAEHASHHAAAHAAHEAAAARTETKPAAPAASDGAAAGSGQPKESFQQLLKEAGVDENKRAAKPVLSRKMLSADDFKSGMDGVAGAAKGCYKGTQGLAMMKLVVAASGKVQSVTITGAFAGKPEGACVAHAVRQATFPPWDGGPQTFHYSYLLAE